MSLQEIFDFIIFQIGDYEFAVKNLLLIILVVVVSQLIQRGLKRGWLHLEKFTFLSEEAQEKVLRFFKIFVQFFALVLIVISAGFSISEILSTVVLDLGSGDNRRILTIGDIKDVVLVFIVARIIIWLVKQAIMEYHKQNELEIGVKYAAIQFIKYIVYTSAILTALPYLGYELSVVWGGAAALLVGFGLGLQQTFNDLVSGIILLIERKVEVGDIVEVDDFVGTIKKIGIRTSDVLTRDNILVLVPNSLLVTSKVINWSHKEDRRRFCVSVGVAYASDVELVKELLLKVGNAHVKVGDVPKPFVRFTDFGDSSLNFELHFWTDEIIDIDDLKSDLRFGINRIFKEHKVEIPFPQRDVWIRKN